MEDKSEKKVRFGEITKKDTDTLKLKQDELDKLKLSYNKVRSINKIHANSCNQHESCNQPTPGHP